MARVMSDIPPGRVLREVSEKIARITIDRPNKLNAFDTELYGQFRDAILSLKDADIDLVVIGATGRAFSTGGDLSEVRDLVDSGAGLQAFFDKLPFHELRGCRATTIARVQGPC